MSLLKDIEPIKTIDYLKEKFQEYYKNAQIILPPRFTSREWGFLNWKGGIMNRHIKFSSRKEVSNYLSRVSPAHCYHSVAYYSDPNKSTMIDKEWLGADLIFDLDADHLPEMEDVKKGKITFSKLMIYIREQTYRLVVDVLLGDFGLTKVKNDEYVRKTNDRLEVNSVAGWEINDSNWYYSFFANFRTQFAKGYEYDEVDVLDEVTGNVVGTEIVRTETTHFMSPGYLQVGPGMLWKKNENFKVNFAPATARFIFVDDRFTTMEGYEDGDYFGVDQGKSMRFEFGASVSAYAKFDLVENVTFENMINLYSNYLEDPQNVDLDYTGKLNMKVNDYLSANFIFQTIYDDNAVKAFQVREVLGVGFTYKINPQEEE